MLMRLVQRVETQTGSRVKAVRSDGEGGFKSKVFQAFLSDRGIQHQTSMAAPSASNGIAERAIRTDNDRIATMLTAANLPLSFWGDAYLTEIHVWNISPNSSNRHAVPHTLFYGHRPNIHLEKSMLRYDLAKHYASTMLRQCFGNASRKLFCPYCPLPSLYASSRPYKLSTP